MRSLDDIIESRQAAVSGPTPLPSTGTLSTPGGGYTRPVTPSDIWQQAFQPMTISAHQAYGLQQTQRFNVSDPSSMMGPAAANMMTMANLAPMRTPFATPAPALHTTPGVTSMFHSPGDIAAQQGLTASAAFLDPRTASANLSSQRAEAWGQKYGGTIGNIAGMIAGSFAPGVGSGIGGSVGGLVGGFLGEQLLNMPGIKQAREFMNRDVAQNLSWMAAAQHGTVGRVSLTGEDIGLGGRGMNAQSAMKLGQQFKGMAGSSGGMFNQTDLSNLTQAAGDAGLLDAATNIDQISDTVGSLMKVIGRLGKLTGDPDFRNNIRELGNLKKMGFTADQAIGAMSDMNRYARGAGMTRGQMGAVMQSGAGQAMGVGLTGAVGMQAAAYGAAQGRMLGGAFNPIQESLMGDVGQRIQEGQIAFAAQTTKLFVPSLLSVGKDGELTLDPEKMAKLGGVGAVNMQAMAAHGQQNLHSVAQQIAKQTGRSVTDVMAEVMGRMTEFQSQMSTEMGPAKMQRVRSNMMLGLRETFGEFTAAQIVAGGDPLQAQILLAQMKDPKRYERELAQTREDIASSEGAARSQASQEASYRRDRSQWWNRAGRAVGGFFGDIGKQMWGEDADDLIEAQEEARKIEDQAMMTRTGMKNLQRQRGGVGENRAIIKEMKQNAKQQGLDLSRGEGMGSFVQEQMEELNVHIDDSSRLSSEEISGYLRATGEAGSITGGLIQLGHSIGDFFGVEIGRGKEKAIRAAVRRRKKEDIASIKPIQEAMKRSYEGNHEMQVAFMDDFDRSGMDGVALLANLKNSVLSAAKTRGEDAGSMPVAELRRVMRKSLREKGVPESKIDSYMKDNGRFMTQLGLGVIVTEGTDEAKFALKESMSLGDMFSKFDVSGENMEELEQEIRAKGLQTLIDAGIIEEEQVWTELTEQGFGRRFADVEEEYAHGLMTGSRKAGVQATGKTGAMTRTLLAYVAASNREGEAGIKAREELTAFERNATKEEKAALRRAREIYRGPGMGTKEEQKDRQGALGRYLEGEKGKGGFKSLVAKDLGIEVSEVGIKEMSKAMEDAQQRKGSLKWLYHKEISESIRESQKGGGKTVGDADTYSAGTGGPDAKRAEMLKMEVETIEKQREAWIGKSGKGGVTGELRSVAEKWESVADRLIEELDRG